MIRSILLNYRGNSDPILIEATCNQVNQEGGYTGMTPRDFRKFVETLAREAQVDPARIIFGGDHLGPNPWKHLPARDALARAKDMVRAYVEAGFSKIHLDASMACADDLALDDAEIASRSAELCAAAEAVRAGLPLAYIIGTEVPVPGGETQTLDALAVTRPDAARTTFDVHKSAFERCELSEAFSRVIGIVVQPGVDFGNDQIFAFQPAKAARLSRSVLEMPNVVFEAHSTDYQSRQALADLVASHFAILKVGPELTFAYREALVAMAAIEDRLNIADRSGLAEVIEQVMDQDEHYWRAYVARDADEKIVRLFGLSDRIRYYWTHPDIGAAVRKLRTTLDTVPVTTGLLWQFTGGPLSAEFGTLPLSARIIQHKVGTVVEKYRKACGG